MLISKNFISRFRFVVVQKGDEKVRSTVAVEQAINKSVTLSLPESMRLNPFAFETA
jgi:hypothetical protein